MVRRKRDTNSAYKQTDAVRKEFFERYKTGECDSQMFSDFLSMKFKIKKVLNQLGLFNLSGKLLKG